MEYHLTYRQLIDVNTVTYTTIVIDRVWQISTRISCACKQADRNHREKQMQPSSLGGSTGRLYATRSCEYRSINKSVESSRSKLIGRLVFIAIFWRQVSGSQGCWTRDARPSWRLQETASHEPGEGGGDSVARSENPARWRQIAVPLGSFVLSYFSRIIILAAARYTPRRSNGAN